jgi:hypothetical protein
MWAGPVGMLLWCYLLAGLSYYVSQSSDARGRSAGSNLLALGVRATCGPHGTRTHCAHA